MKIKISVSIDQELKQPLDVMARELGIAPSNLINMMILERWKERGKKLDTKAM